MVDSLKNIAIGTRGSKLALYQANLVKSRLEEAHTGLKCSIKIIKTSGDILKEANLATIGGKGLFIKEIEQGLLDKQIDIAVHSLKDMPAFLPENLHIPYVLERESPLDCLISYKIRNINEIKDGDVIGTSSPRRAAQLQNKFPNIKIVNFRGNVQTRIQKLQDKIVDHTILAKAGLNRLEMYDNNFEIPKDIMLPAICQGIIGIECRKDDKLTNEILAKINHKPTQIISLAERAFLGELDGSCTTPLAALATIEGSNINLEALIAKTDGSKIYKTKVSGSIDKPEDIGIKAASDLKPQAKEIF